MATTLGARLDQDGRSTSRVTVRSHTVYVDRPAIKGGADRGPLGGEYVLVGLGGCFTSHLLAAISARQAPIADVSVAVSGTLDGTPERFTAFELVVSASSADPELLAHCVALAERSCQVVTTLRLAAAVAIRIDNTHPRDSVGGDRRAMKPNGGESRD
jgi:putative redox protein